MIDDDSSLYLPVSVVSKKPATDPLDSALYGIELGLSRNLSHAETKLLKSLLEARVWSNENRTTVDLVEINRRTLSLRRMTTEYFAEHQDWLRSVLADFNVKSEKATRLEEAERLARFQLKERQTQQRQADLDAVDL
jgi:hypothetical protein